MGKKVADDKKENCSRKSWIPPIEATNGSITSTLVRLELKFKDEKNNTQTKALGYIIKKLVDEDDDKRSKREKSHY